MIKLIAIPSLLLISLSFLFSNCKNNQSSDIGKLRQDSLNTVLKSDSQKIASELNKYLIQPPDTDYTGDYVDKYANGVIKFTGFFRFGLRHGQWMAFYDNGIKWSECFYDKGKRQGASMVYFPNGKLQYSGWYKNDLRDSLWFFYDETGKEIDKRAFKNDIETGLVN
jgi:antitoxin component YwqK of YwqJK toxin-antitoxin module